MSSKSRTKSRGPHPKRTTAHPPARAKQASRPPVKGPNRAARRRGETGPSWRRSALVLAVIVVAVGVGVAVQALRASRSTGALTRPSFAASNGAVTEGDATAKVTVTEYGDFQCPHCRELQLTVGPTIQKLVADHSIRFSYVPMAFLGSESGLASNAAYCSGRDSFWAYRDYLFAHQAPENSGALTTQTLTSFGSAVGVTSPSFASCVEGRTYLPFVQHVTDLASQAGVNQTPTLFIDGKPAPPSAYTAAGLTAAVRAAASA
ncbi:MAG TPA: thioredoxin domain-containing protein [Actinomycetota bacterium]|nr:thioredoxin domain-containing protein [Actinomycetota bacterium]